jgi:3-dehydrosphinganine reductase
MSVRDYFNRKHVVVTGGSSGIGLAFAQRVAEAGAAVTLVARRKTLLEEAKRAIEARSPGATVRLVELDIANEDAVGTAMDKLVKERSVDMLVNNAGVVMPGRFLELPSQEFRQMMDINFFGTVYMSKALLPAFASHRSGHVLNVSSLAGVMGIYGYTAYAASKFALVGFSQALRAEMWPHGVKVSICLPPDTDTPQLAQENQFKPAETKAIAGTVKTLPADTVAAAMADGMAKGSFEIYPDLGSKLVALGQGVLPGVARWVCDSAQKKAATIS